MRFGHDAARYGHQLQKLAEREKDADGAVGARRDGGFDFATEPRRWFDYWLKGIENGINSEPPIYHHVVNSPADKAWRFAKDWPLAEAATKLWFLQRENAGHECAN